MSKLKKIIYVGVGRFPTEKANGYQIAQMLQAFENNGVESYLIHYDERSLLDRNITPESMYSLRINLKRISYELPKILSKLLANKYLGIFTSLILLRIQAHKTKLIIKSKYNLDDIIIYTRHIWVANYLRNNIKNSRTCVELHSLPEKENKFNKKVKILKKIPKIICLTNVMRERLLKAGIKPGQLITAHDAVDNSVFTGPSNTENSKRLLNLNVDEKNICYVGRFTTLGQEKGIPEIIRAASIILKKHNDIYFTLVGGPLTAIESYKELINKLGIEEGKFIFPGYKPVDVIKKYLDASDILLLPMPYTHHYANNASPLKLFQYLTSKKPIIATDLPSIREIVGDGHAALLPKAGDVKELANSIHLLLTNKRIVNQISNNAYKISKKYTWNNRARQIINFINQ